MTELEQIRKMAEELAEKAQQGTTPEVALALEKITQAFKAPSEVEKSQAEIRKLAIDEQKARYDLDHASRQERVEGRQRYITILTPIATTLVLGFTLLSQTYQFVKSERDKQQALEDAQWSEAVKTVSQSAQLSPIAITLNPFLKSKRYADVARKTAVEALISTRDSTVFADLFKGAFVPMDWANLDTVLQLDRALGPRLGEIWHVRTERIKTKEPNDSNQADHGHDEMQTPPPNRRAVDIPKGEQQDYDYITSVLTEISVATAPLLKGPRPARQVVDLRSAWFLHCDWSGVNLYGADIQNIVLNNAILKGADLGGITSFNDVSFYYSAWWDAKRVSPQLLEYLIKKYPYDVNDANEGYGPNSGDKRVSLKDYTDAIERLKAGR